jgi:opacity protein-like surface antigen
MFTCVFNTAFCAVQEDQELIIKAGLGLFGELNYNNKILFNGSSVKDIPPKSSDKVDANADLSLEYLYTTASKLKLGLGIAYSVSRPIHYNDFEKEVLKKLDLESTKVSAYPIYATLQFYPIDNLTNLYLKGNLGLSIFYIKPSLNDTIDAMLKLEEISLAFNDDNTYFGLYYGFGLGYDLPSGLFFEILYDFNCAGSNLSIHQSSGENVMSSKIDYTFSKLAFSVGYRFKL